MTRIRITPRQVDQAQWAIDAMRDYATEDDCEYEETDVPKVDGLFIVFPTDNRDAVEDILYRLEEQLPDMGYQAIDVIKRALSEVLTPDAIPGIKKDVLVGQGLADRRGMGLPS